MYLSARLLYTGFVKPQARLGDVSLVPRDGHGRACCAHTCIGPAVTGSPDVRVNNLPALRVGDFGVHSHCCDSNMWVAVLGSGSVRINNLEAHRLGDLDEHCGGPGFMVQGSPDVKVGD
jgi:uncharacterized Zn-binding protein involved in type VI secretion